MTRDQPVKAQTELLHTISNTTTTTTTTAAAAAAAAAVVVVVVVAAAAAAATTTTTTTAAAAAAATTTTTTTTRSTSVDPYSSLPPANPVIHRCWQTVSGDPGVRLQQIDICASPSSDAPFAMLRFPQNQIANNFIFTPVPLFSFPLRCIRRHSNISSTRM